MRARLAQHLVVLGLVVAALTTSAAMGWAGGEGVAHVPAVLDALLP